MKWLAALAIGILVVVGCGGSGTQVGPAAGFYRGTIQSPGTAMLPAGSGPIVVDVNADGTFEAHGKVGSTLTALARTAGGGLLQVGFSSFAVTITTQPGSGTLVLTAKAGSETVATVTLDQAELPTITTTCSIPPPGSYHGDVLIVANGHVREYGTVTATVDASGHLTASSYGGGGWAGGGQFGGDFQINGTLTDAGLGLLGSVILETTPPAYCVSGDGTITMRFDQLGLEPGSGLFTLVHD
jgi:hypothetical protein